MSAPGVLEGPAGGRWVLTDAGRPALRCVLCGALVARAWRYFTGARSLVCVCEGCAGELERDGASS